MIARPFVSVIGHGESAVTAFVTGDRGPKGFFKKGLEPVAWRQFRREAVIVWMACRQQVELAPQMIGKL